MLKLFSWQVYHKEESVGVECYLGIIFQKNDPKQSIWMSQIKEHLKVLDNFRGGLGRESGMPRRVNKNSRVTQPGSSFGRAPAGLQGDSVAVFWALVQTVKSQSPGREKGCGADMPERP